MEIAERFIEVFRSCADQLNHDEPVHCSIGMDAGVIEGFYPNTGTKEYDLYGQSIIVANRYEGLRKYIFEQVDFDILIIQDEVYQRLPHEMQKNLPPSILPQRTYASVTIRLRMWSIIAALPMLPKSVLRDRSWKRLASIDIPFTFSRKDTATVSQL
ncbi:MAG: hypothetical protein M3Q07_02445 [Pseudobdellovibrionaceae bacterium]|nr:hypothetical protein [Pseudobdellovibrionaceae bacterium]